MEYCRNCGKEINNINASKFCNRTCYREYRAANPGEYGKKATTHKCAYCGKDGLIRKPSELRNQVFCSRECSNKAQSDSIKQLADIDLSNGAKLSCKFCHKPFFVKPHRAKKAMFCSRKCAHDFRGNRPLVMNKIEKTGERNPNFRNWSARNTARKRAIELMGHKCVLCDFDIIIHVHHINPLSVSGDNDIGNLVVLCPNHHEMADCGMINPNDLLAINREILAKNHIKIEPKPVASLLNEPELPST